MEYNGRYNRTSDEKEEEEEEEEEGEMEQEDQEDDKDEDDRVEQKDQKDQKKEKELKKEEVEKRTKKDDTSSHKKYYKCKYAVENSSRFSLRVIEAMRSLQRHENVLPISSVNEIVDYIANNYNNDGDLYAQVRTALKQLCTEGNILDDIYI
ncbi:myelin transcription factor 1-like protein [Vespa mandarinia]|uniref:myelin transcription factor 1-like protein n=1 Tax=Vespa mandarinia TaxID=7446 RepID=UPI0016194806|nr:myelin transcription factor 1-like protein [Vespa mandarinia]